MAAEISELQGVIGSEIGQSGLVQYNGYITEEKDKRLRDRKRRMETYAEMLNDATVAAAMTALDAFMRSCNWVLNPADEKDARAVEIRDRVRDSFNRMEGDWGQLFSEINTQNAYGFSLFEIVYADEEVDGWIGWDRWAPRGQGTIERWQFDNGGRELTGAYQRAEPNYQEVFLPINRLIHFTTRRRKQNPEGSAMLRPMFEAWFFKTQIMRIEAIGIEREMVGMPVFRLPAKTISGPLGDTWREIGANLRKDEQTAIYLPSETDANGNYTHDFNLVNAGGQRAIDTNVVIARYERIILRTLLADFMALGDQGGGSYALGSSRLDFFGRMVMGLLDSVADTINEQAIKRLVNVNGYPSDLAPVFAFDNLDRKDMTAFAAAYAQLATAGVRGLDSEEVLTEVYDVMGLPIPDDGLGKPEIDEDELTDRIIGKLDARTAATQLPANTEEPSAPVGSGQTFTEDVSDGLMDDAAEAFRRIAGPKLGGLIDAEVTT